MANTERMNINDILVATLTPL